MPDTTLEWVALTIILLGFVWYGWYKVRQWSS